MNRNETIISTTETTSPFETTNAVKQTQARQNFLAKDQATDSRIAQPTHDLNKNEARLPRSEYYSRFEGTTAHEMAQPTHWNSYHRSERSRFFSIVGKRESAQFISPCVQKKGKANSFSAHIGGYRSPFTFDYYGDEITLKDKITERNTNVHDQLLAYKNQMAKIVVESFTKESKTNEQRKSSVNRPIVYVENNYPCVLIALPALNSHEYKTEAAKYWSKHPKPLQKLSICIFTALLNVNAMREKIPIEMVIRASFGHNLPSICETNDTFRINIGIVPLRYAKLIGKTLHQLNQLMGKFIGKPCDKTSSTELFSENFLERVRNYNAIKLRKIINEKKIYKPLRKTPHFKSITSSDKSFSESYNKFCAINKKTKTRKGKSTFKPVELKNKTMWQTIRQSANTKGNSILYECFRQNGTEDWFVDQVMAALIADDKNPIESALKKLVGCLLYEETVSMDYARIRKELKRDKRHFEHPSFEQIYADDPEFLNIITLLCNAFLIEKRPSQALYATLEQASIQLLTTYRGSDTVLEEPDYGSSSDFSEDLSDNEQSTSNNHFSHSKLRVCSGMKAIVLAQYGALSYLKLLGIKEYYAEDRKQMYYEVSDAIKYIAIDSPKINKVRASWEIWHFDLNHCNANNSENTDGFKEKLTALERKTIAVLDYTSSTEQTIKDTVKQCFSNSKIQLVIFVNSGLKNEQGGADFNPYGEVRVFARDRKTSKEIVAKMKEGLSNKDKLTQKSHEMVRVCKRSRLALSFSSLFHKNRLNVEEENPDVIKQNEKQQEALPAIPLPCKQFPFAER